MEEMKPLIVNALDASFKSTLVEIGEDIEEREEQVGENHVAHHEAKEGPVRNDVDVKRLNEE